MEYADTVMRAIRVAVRNPFAVVLVSLAASMAVLPFLTGLLVAGAVGGLVGLWTSSFMLGFVAVGGARISTVVLERQVSLGTSYFWEGMRNGTRMATAVGAGTFLVAAVALALALNPLDGVAGLSVAMFGVYAILGWFTLVVFSLTRWASFGQSLGVRASFREGGRLILERPIAAVWLVVQAVGWTLISIPLIIAPVVILPGFVQLVGTELARAAAEGDDE